ncbi:uncharacterized protein LOC122403574 [Colletes gigas]|uniref:uncharacterized protein LOC122403574 n=1 Tax=Colletes gigas TaxID=935657 RepID=UPI001C9ABBB7|nr:uncharacterized protein LOC122403574 [Colletes gigas]
MTTFQMTDDQLNRLLATLTTRQTSPPTTSQGSFARCTTRFGGSTNRTRVEEFISTISIYKEIENIFNVNGIKGLPLLLEDEAATWWHGVKEDVTTWAQAMDLLRAAYAPKKPGYAVYAELFATKQTKNCATDVFIAQKRALFAELTHKHAEEIQLDMIYSLLKLRIREKIPRCSVKNFEELIGKARTFEALEEEAREQQEPFGKPLPTQEKKLVRCSFCRKTGHSFEECRRRKAKEPTKLEPPTLHCYGCGNPGVIRSRCPQCSQATVSSIQTADFCSVSLAQARNRPTARIQIEGFKGHAFFDTGAKVSIASDSLYNKLAANGTKFQQRKLLIALADGHPRIRSVLCADLTVQLKDRNIKSPFIVLPGATENRTLLGIDFLETAGIIINAAQRSWNYVDQPKNHHFFEEEPPVKVSQPKSRKFPKKELALVGTQEPPAQTPKKRMPDEEDWSEMCHMPPLLSPLSPTPKKTQQTDILDDLFDRCFQTYRLDLASVDVLLRPEEAEGLDQNEKRQLEQLLIQHLDLFETSEESTTFAEHRIDTGDNAPIAVPPYRLSPARKAVLRDEIDEMLQKDIIEESESPWAAPVVMVAKKDGGVRVCVDYRRLNAITVTDTYPLPRIDDLIHATTSTRFMTTLDLRSGYWQIPVHQKDQEKTTFVTPFGTYRFKRMPFGLKNAPATFQRMMDRLRAPLGERMIIAYLDDLLILSSSFNNHLADLKATFSRIRFFGLRMNREKCYMCCPEIKYLGHIITPSGIEADPEKISAILERQAPTNVKGVLSFVQTCSWYRRFIPGFAQTAEPLTRLTRKKTSWHWGEKQKKSFQDLKRMLTEAPVLKPANPKMPYTIRTDASGYALGAALVQGEKEEEHPVEYASRLLTTAERNYSTTEREALAVVWAINKFRGYIEGSEVRIMTDHQPLRWLMTLKTPSGRLARWALLLQEFNIQIDYCPGKSNYVADYLSRPQREDTDNEDECNIGLISVDMPARKSNEIREEQLKDEETRKIIECFEETRQSENFLHWTQKGYLLSNGVLYRHAPDTDNAADALGTYHTSALTPCRLEEASLPSAPIAPIRRRGRPRKTNQKKK